MVCDIAGFLIVTLLLIVIDSYILCEHQNTSRILLSIGIDYAILFLYISARNVAMSSESSAAPQAQSRTYPVQERQRDLKWEGADSRAPTDGRPMATQ